MAESADSYGVTARAVCALLTGCYVLEHVAECAHVSDFKIIAAVNADSVVVVTVCTGGIGIYKLAIVVVKLFYDFLFNKNGIANRAVATLGKTGYGTSRFFCRVNNLGVTQFSLLVVGSIVATRASNVSIPTNLCASFALRFVADN